MAFADMTFILEGSEINDKLVIDLKLLESDIKLLH